MFIDVEMSIATDTDVPPFFVTLRSGRRLRTAYTNVLQLASNSIIGAIYRQIRRQRRRSET